MGREGQAVVERLLDWYAEHQRDLPWRRSGDAYAVWVSEIMLQQTRVDTVIPYFERFLARFPTVEALARAPLQDVLKAWENLGYYSRARNLHQAAREVVARFSGEIPQDREALRSLPGIGPYTAAAILSFAFGKPEATVDGNVRRVLCRVFGIQDPVDRAPGLRAVEARAGDLVPEDRPGDFNQALMDLGSSVCTPRAPRCSACPLQGLCAAEEDGDPEALPVKEKRKPVPRRLAVAGVIQDSRGRLLVVKRADQGLLGGLWKLPGGEVGPGEDPARALEERIHAEVGIRVRAEKEPAATVEHVYSHFRLTLQAHVCRRLEGRPRAGDCDGWQWVEGPEWGGLPFSRADRKVLEGLGTGLRIKRGKG